ncbi:hypothetical protein V1525DRAFT_424499 [Lipomyces kononenkoae]|uniref:Uncharacterized protein n=1 Tax=Lipomyces kononenkoae TaxID=34357 RepID=A0ACC3T736_LIPKO
MKLFGPAPEFWKLKHEEGGDAGETPCRVRLRNKLTDGISVSLTETTVVLKKKRQTKNESEISPDPRQDTIRMPYVDKGTIAVAAPATQFDGSEYKQVGFRELFDAPDTPNLTKGDAKLSWPCIHVQDGKKHAQLRQRLQQEDIGMREEEGRREIQLPLWEGAIPQEHIF